MSDDDVMRSEARRLNLGATGEYPDGVISPSDEGEIRLAVTASARLVLINFGKPVAWFGLSPQEARELANILIKHSYVAEAQPAARRVKT
jgi:hypothetical protein